MTEVWGSSEHREGTRRQTPGTPCWTSLLVQDLEATKEFYGGLFGWSYYNPGPGRPGPYVRATVDGHDVAGIGGLPPDRQLANAWTTYLASDDADASAEWIHCAGGTVGVGPLAAEDAGAAGARHGPGGGAVRRPAGTGDGGSRDGRRAGHPGLARTGDP